MHLVIGLLASTLLAGRTSGKGSSTRPLTFWGVLEVRHVLPGRIRFHCPAVHEDTSAARRIEKELPRLPGIGSVVADERTGSILVVHDIDSLDAQTVETGILKLLGLEEEAYRPQAGTLMRETNELMEALNRGVLDLSNGTVDLDFLVITVLSTLGLARLSRGGRVWLPEGFTLLWWAFAFLARGTGSRAR